MFNELFLGQTSTNVAVEFVIKLSDGGLGQQGGVMLIGT